MSDITADSFTTLHVNRESVKLGGNLVLAALPNEPGPPLGNTRFFANPFLALEAPYKNCEHNMEM
jgi:hypothetical protein